MSRRKPLTILSSRYFEIQARTINDNPSVAQIQFTADAFRASLTLTKQQLQDLGLQLQILASNLE